MSNIADTLRQRLRDKGYPLLLKHRVRWAEQVLDGALSVPELFDYRASLIHGDLAPYHILFDADKGAITGVIDFGVAGIGDPALDLGCLLSYYGESFIVKMKPAYPDLESLLRRARFYARSLELQWVLLGVETGETFRFAAHLAGARDLEP